MPSAAAQQNASVTDALEENHDSGDVRGMSLGERCGKKQRGDAGIRTLDTASGIPVFETGAFNHSATSPGKVNSVL